MIREIKKDLISRTHASTNILQFRNKIILILCAHNLFFFVNKISQIVIIPVYL